jgi:deoxyribodipyrimidine photolyase-related protein
MKQALIVLGDQLFPPSFYIPHKDKLVFMAEDLGLATHYKYHKHKIAFFFASMRTYADELKAKKFNVHYEELSDQDFFKRLQVFVKKNQIKKIAVAEIQDKFFETKVLKFCETYKLDLDVLESPMFLCSRQEFKNYLFYHPKPFMKTFYEKERKRLKILLTPQGKPEGGQWSYDVENRKKAPKTLTNKALLKHSGNQHLKDVIKLVGDKFPSHPGSLDNFWLPINRKEALKILDHFLAHHLSDFGDYQDSITSRDPFLYHSMISPMVNNGLITPKEVVDKVLDVWEKDSSIPLNCVEGFVRQVLGWREFVRGIYQNFSELEESKNFFNHKRKLTKDWYQGTTGILPVDDAIKKAQTYGYCHHIERLMVLSNFMLLSEIDPKEVHKWFMEMFVDSADWVMGPNVYGMGQFSDGGLFATKPYISGSNYVLKMSDYKKGEEWCDIWDGLFWRFIDNHSAFFSKNPRMNMMVKLLEKMDKTKKSKLFKLAEDFLQAKTRRVSE